MSVDTEEPLSTSPHMVAQHPEPPQPQPDTTSMSLISLTATGYCDSFCPDSVKPEAQVAAVLEPENTAQPPEPDPEADEQILEALRSPKDRLFVLKLGENMESLIIEKHIRTRYELTPASSYHKLLVHRCAAYYKLVPETESGSKSITLAVVSESRIPSRRVADLVPIDSAPLPAFKIMRRTPLRTRSKTSSQTGSGNDDSAPGTGDVSDGDPSEAGSSRGSRNKKLLSMSERQAQYDEARSRIFKDLEEKEKQKAQDMSASSSTLSLLSMGSSSGGGVSGGGSSSVGESIDDAGSVDRDWIPPNKENKIDGSRRASSAASGSSRGLRSTAPTFTGHGQSTGFMYPTLYDPNNPNPTTTSTSSTTANPPYHQTLYPVYQFGAPAYLAPYPYAYYPYPQPSSSHDPNTAVNESPSSPADGYPPMPFMNQPYVWGVPQHQQGMPPPPTHPVQGHPEYGQMSYPPPMHHPYPYSGPIPGYIQPLHTHPQPSSQHPHQAPQQPQQSQHKPQPQPQPQPQPHSHQITHQPHPYPVHAQTLTIIQNGYRSNPAMNHNQFNTHTNGNQPAWTPRSGDQNQLKKAPMRPNWSFGPGVGGGGSGPPSISSETIGPRMGCNRRATGGSSASGGRTPGDETASTTTFTSTSSKHPLPARPDWAVGLKPQPTLHSNSPRSHHQQLPSQRPPFLQAQDFPPLPISAPNANPEKRPAPGGVWAGPSTTRNILGPSLSRINNVSAQSINGNGTDVPVRGNGNVVNGSGQQQQQQQSRLDEDDLAFERPGPKAGVELFNPNAGVAGSTRAKSPTRRTNTQDRVDKDKDKERASARGEAVANAILVGGMTTLRIGQEQAGGLEEV
ncbi:hypothetical protein BU17DRAFT_68792 [Hysterangium stoloniferum]|nr:hypothetical protein BU17DRAFT_68792 [Hysterangium stoloniferum]